jgi:N-acetylneuraminate synthase
MVQAGVWHSFRTKNGCIFEEVSTTHYNDDSFYKDKRIASLERWERKTKVNHWGRWELKDQRQMSAFLPPTPTDIEVAADEQKEPAGSQT